MQMIRASEQRNFSRILVLCPAIGRVSWAIQFRTWLSKPRPVYTYPNDTAGLIPPGPLALIVTIDWLQNPRNAAKLIKALRTADPFGVAFVDEAHYLKNPEANRTRAVYGNKLDLARSVLERCRAVWLATATITPNHVGELYPHLRGLFGPMLLQLFANEMPSDHDFKMRFTNMRHTNFGWQIDGNDRKEIPALRDALRPYFLARLKRDVLPDLDPITQVLLPLEVQDKGDPIDARLAALLQTAEGTALNDLLDDEHVASRRRALGELKATAVIEWIKNLLQDPDKKLVVFAYHRSVLDKLQAAFAPKYGTARIDGSTPHSARLLAVDRFQNSPGCRLFLGQTLASNTSITLTAAQDVLLLEPEWTPVQNYQAISRCHRIGQAGSVTVYFAYAHGTVDEPIIKTLRRKAKDFMDLLGVDISAGTI